MLSLIFRLRIKYSFLISKLTFLIVGYPFSIVRVQTPISNINFKAWIQYHFQFYSLSSLSFLLQSFEPISEFTIVISKSNFQLSPSIYESIFANSSMVFQSCYQSWFQNLCQLLLADLEGFTLKIFYCLIVLISWKFFSYYLNIIIMQNFIFRKVLFNFSQTKPLLYVFAGQGTQEEGMLNKLLQIGSAKKQIQKYSQLLGINFIKLNEKGEQQTRNKTRFTQPLLVLSHVLSFRYGNNKLTQNDFMLGHSVGQYSALCIAGSIDLQNCLKLVSRRGQLMQQHTKQPSGMLIVRFSDQNRSKLMQVVKACNVQIACYNTPNNINIAGTISQLKNVRQTLRQMKITNLFLPVSSAFHSNILKTMKNSFEQCLNNVKFEQPLSKILRNLDTQIYKKEDDIRQGLLQHLTNPVQFQESIRKIDPQIECIEIGLKEHAIKYVRQTRKKMKQQ